MTISHDPENGQLSACLARRNPVSEITVHSEKIAAITAQAARLGVAATPSAAAGVVLATLGGRRRRSVIGWDVIGSSSVLELRNMVTEFARAVK